MIPLKRNDLDHAKPERRNDSKSLHQRQTPPKVSHQQIAKWWRSRAYLIQVSSGVGNSDTGRARRCTRQHLSVLLHVNDRGTSRSDRSRRGSSFRVRESDGAEVGERNELVTLLEVLHDPFGVGLTQMGGRGDGGGDGLAARYVLDGRSAGSGGGGVDGDGHDIAGLDGDTTTVRSE